MPKRKFDRNDAQFAWTQVGRLLDAYAEIESQLEAWASSGPQGMSKDEKKRFKVAAKVRDQVNGDWMRAGGVA